MSKLSKLQESGDLQIGKPITLSTGIKVKLNYVPVMLIEQAQQLIKNPKVPIIDTEDGRELENPNDPIYLEAIEETARRRIQAVYDIIMMYGVDLVDGLPEDDEWINKVKWLGKKGLADLSDIDFDDPYDVKLIFLRSFAIGNSDLVLISQLAGLTEEDVQEAEQTFQRNEERDSDSDVSPEK